MDKTDRLVIAATVGVVVTNALLWAGLQFAHPYICRTICGELARLYSQSLWPNNCCDVVLELCGGVSFSLGILAFAVTFFVLPKSRKES